MKKVLYFLSLICLSLFVACSNNDNDDPEENDNQKEGIELKGYPDSSNKMSLVLSAQSLTIDWGDGIIEEYTPTGNEVEYTHQYTGQSIQKISVKGEKITSFYVDGVGKYSEIRIGDCPYLQKVLCNKTGENLTVLEIKKAESLELLQCVKNQLTTLDLSGCENLKILNCADNKITSLAIEKCTTLTTLNCVMNELSLLDVSGLVKLNYFTCIKNKITSLDVKSCTALVSFFCFENKLTSLDVSGLELLERLQCESNNLTELNIKNCKALNYLSCTRNPLDSEAICSIFTDLPVRDLKDGILYMPHDFSSACTDVLVNKGWSIENL